MLDTNRVMLVMEPTGTDTFPGVDVMLTSGNSAAVCRHGRDRDQSHSLSVNQRSCHPQHQPAVSCSTWQLDVASMNSHNHRQPSHSATACVMAATDN